MTGVLKYFKKQTLKYLKNKVVTLKNTLKNKVTELQNKVANALFLKYALFFNF